MAMQVDLRSDTVTQPSFEMKQAMLNAPLGDDVFAEDPTVIKLEQKLATMFGMEAGLFCPSGTMSNQIAIKAHTQPLDEIICDQLSHIYNYETGGWAFHSGVSVRLTQGENGKMTPAQMEALILPDFDWYPNTKMVSIENTVNKGGGSVYTIDEIKAIGESCKKHNLIYHLDGARLFNALEVLNASPIDLAGIFDSISICLSKGLGAPVGSVLLGKKDFIKKSRKIRKVMGGGMRQAGMLAAACIYALENNVVRLKEDHIHAQHLATALRQNTKVKKMLPVETNIVIFEVENAYETAAKLAELSIKTSPFSPIHVRMVTHLDVTQEMIDYTILQIEKM
jgi:threonine aldolase